MASYYYNDHNPFRFPAYIFKFGNPREVEITKALICTQESKTMKDSGRSSNMTSSCKWPIVQHLIHFATSFPGCFPNRNLVSRVLS